MSFWLQLGVSGFRLDAVPFLIELRGTGVEDRDPHESPFLAKARTVTNVSTWTRRGATRRRC